MVSGPRDHVSIEPLALSRSFTPQGGSQISGSQNNNHVPWSAWSYGQMLVPTIAYENMRELGGGGQFMRLDASNHQASCPPSWQRDRMALDPRELRFIQRGDIDLMTNALTKGCLPEQKSACLDAALAPVQVALIWGKWTGYGIEQWLCTMLQIPARIESKGRFSLLISRCRSNEVSSYRSDAVSKLMDREEEKDYLRILSQRILGRSPIYVRRR